MSEPTTPITPAAPVPAAPAAPPAQAVTPPPAAAPAQEPTDWKAEALKWEKRSKDNYAALQARDKAIEDSTKSAEQKAAEAAADATAARREALAYKVAASVGNLKIAQFLTGTTEEELKAQADTLMALIPQAPEAPPAPPVGPTVPGQKPGGTQSAALITQADLDALGNAGKYDEINRLRREGRLSHLGIAPPLKR